MAPYYQFIFLLCLILCMRSATLVEKKQFNVSGPFGRIEKRFRVGQYKEKRVNITTNVCMTHSYENNCLYLSDIKFVID